MNPPESFYNCTHYQEIKAQHHQEIKEKHPRDLTEREFALKLLEKVLENKVECDDLEKKIIAKLIADVLDNNFDKIFDDALQTFAQNNPAKNIMQDISHRTRNRYELTLSNLSQIKDIKAEELTEADKLTLKQFAILRDMSALLPIFKKLNEHKLLQNEKVQKVFDEIQECSKAVKNIEQQIASKLWYPSLFGDSSQKQPLSDKNLFIYFKKLAENFLRPEERLAKKPSGPEPKTKS